MKLNSVIVEPIQTEKATELAKKQVYMFYVSEKTTKHQIKLVLENLYKVEISNVRSATRHGKTIRRGRRMSPKKLADRRIVFVKVKKGKIDLFPQT